MNYIYISITEILAQLGAAARQCKSENGSQHRQARHANNAVRKAIDGFPLTRDAYGDIISLSEHSCVAVDRFYHSVDIRIVCIVNKCDVQLFI
mgnify:CR=1 FL=1